MKNDEYMIELLKASIINGNVETIKTIGFSMEPIIRQNDKISIKAFDSYFIGEIIVFKYKAQGLLVHRIINIIGNEIMCKGDNTNRVEHITKKDIIGKVILINDDILK